MRRLLCISLRWLVGALLAAPTVILLQKLPAQDSLALPIPQAAQEDAGHNAYPYKLAREFLRQRTFGNRPIKPDAYDKAKEEWRLLPRKTAAPLSSREQFRGLSAVTSLKGVVWKAIGPSPISLFVPAFMQAGGTGINEVNGRVDAIAINPNNPNEIYQGSSGGGVWRSIDAGTTWTPLFDQEPALGIGKPSAIAINPFDTDTIYVGTTMDFVLNLSKGILKSTDGGGSWILLGSGFPADNTGNAAALFAGRNISKIIVDPADSRVLYLAANNGLFRSVDGGQNWTQGMNGDGNAQSLVLDTSSPAASRILYAGINGSGIRRSTDGGQNWAQILSATTPAVQAILTPSSDPRFAGTRALGKIVVALAPPTSPPNRAGIQVMYSSIEIITGPGTFDDPAIFASTDQGETWVLRASGLNPRTATSFLGFCQCSFTMEMGIDPASQGDGINDIIYWGGTIQVKSINSGMTFADIRNGQHVDTHSEWVFVPQPSAPSIVYTGNDGGIYRSTDGGAHWTGTGLPGAPATINAGGLQTALFYTLDIKKDNIASLTLGASQDNGIARSIGALDLTWAETTIGGGDGWDVAFDSEPAPPLSGTNRAFHSSGFFEQDNNCTRVFRSDDNGLTWPTNITPWTPPSDQGCYLAPLTADPTNPGFWYVSGSQNLWQSRNFGDNWRILNNFGGTGAIDVAKANANHVVFGVNNRLNNQVFVSTNALAATVGPPTGVTFTNITRNLPNRLVTRVAFDPNDPTVIYATLSGFNSQTPDQPGHIFRTTIGGSIWTDISPALDIPFNAIALDGTPAPTAIYAGTDLGVIRSVDRGKSWTVLDDIHLPNVPVTELVLNSRAGVLRAATFGRGAFEFAAPDGPIIAVNAQNGLQFGTVCRGTTVSLILQVFNVGTQNLFINSVQRLFGSTGFTVLPNPSTPLIISPNAEVDFTVQFTPTTLGTRETATIRISSDDPAAPAFDLTATGTGRRCEYRAVPHAPASRANSIAPLKGH